MYHFRCIVMSFPVKHVSSFYSLSFIRNMHYRCFDIDSCAPIERRVDDFLPFSNPIDSFETNGRWIFVFAVVCNLNELFGKCLNSHRWCVDVGFRSALGPYRACQVERKKNVEWTVAEKPVDRWWAESVSYSYRNQLPSYRLCIDIAENVGSGRKSLLYNLGNFENPPQIQVHRLHHLRMRYLRAADDDYAEKM